MLRNFKLQKQTQAVPVSDFSILTKPTSRNTVASSDLSPDPSAGFDSGGVMNKGFRGPFLLNSSCHDFEKVDEGRKMSSQLWVHMSGYRKYITYAGQKLNNLMWLRMAGYRKYILYRYVFISSFVSLTKYAGRKINNLMGLRMVGEFMPIYIFWVRFEQSTVDTYGDMLKLSIIYVRFYLFFRFTDKLRGTKTQHSDASTYCVRIHVYIFFRVRLFGLCLTSLLQMTGQGFSETWIRMLFFIYCVQINMSKTSTFWTEIQGCHLTRLV